MSKYVLGLDIGVTSVGWGVINDENGEIIDAGVRLFEEADAENNANRRGFRSQRRLKRRKAYRVERLENLLKSEGIFTKDYKANLYNPYECRLKGLNNKLSNGELVSALIHVAKLRGSSLEVASDDSNKEEGAAKSALSDNIHLLNKGKYVCEVQLDYLREKGKIRGNTNIYRTEDYIKELDKILSNQGLSSELNEKIKNIVSKRRHYAEGPGSKNSPTKYGRFLELGAEPIDLINKMRGYCTIYKDELRAPINSYSYSLYNLYNDLNNLTIDGRKITTEEKEIIVNDYINKKGTITLKEICKVVGLNDEKLISGYRTDKNDKAIFTEFKGYNAIRKAVNNKDHPLNSKILEDIKLINDIIDILTETKIIEERKERILSRTNLVDEYGALLLANITGISQYGYLSYKALNLFIREMKESNDNQMQISEKLSLRNDSDGNLKNRKNIPFDYKDITNPVVIRAQREAIKVVNEVRKQYGELDAIVVEMARERNSKEERDSIKKGQAHNEKINKDLEEYAKEKKLNSKLKLKLRLAIEQNWKCAYSQDKIDLYTLMNDESAYEVDHILPLSLSFDDSFNNKVLVTRKVNQEKGQHTPYEYYSSGKGNMSFEQFSAIVLANENYKSKDKRKKVDNLLYKGNLLDPDTQERFISRNLVDTRYASRTLLNELQRYFKVNNIDTKVFTIRGNITDQFRKKAKIAKDRDFYKHHAIDALIMACIRSNRLLVKKLDKQSYKERKYKKVEYKEDCIIDQETGEVIATDIFDGNTMTKIGYIKSYDYANKIKFSYKVDRKINRSISDQTIYSTRKVNDEDWIVKKYKDIYDNKTAETITKMFKDGTSTKLLVYKNDKQTYDLLETIVKEYPNEKNPFVAYKNDYGPIRKYSKKGNGPAITSLKYLDCALPNHIDITDHYNSNNKKIVLLSINPYRLDFYNVNGVYKFVTVAYKDIKQSKSRYYIDAMDYTNLLMKKGIKNIENFVLSVNKNDIISITRNGESTMYRFCGVSNDRVEMKLIDRKTDPRIRFEISRNVSSIEKYNVDVLGNMYKVDKEDLKLEF